MEVKILGSGCPKCRALYKLAKEVVKQNGIEAIVLKVEDITEILQLGILSTPALVVEGKVLVAGRVPSAEEIKELLTKSK